MHRPGPKVHIEAGRGTAAAIAALRTRIRFLQGLAIQIAVLAVGLIALGFGFPSSESNFDQGHYGMVFEPAELVQALDPRYHKTFTPLKLPVDEVQRFALLLILLAVLAAYNFFRRILGWRNTAAVAVSAVLAGPFAALVMAYQQPELGNSGQQKGNDKFALDYPEALRGTTFDHDARFPSCREKYRETQEGREYCGRQWAKWRDIWEGLSPSIAADQAQYELAQHSYLLVNKQCGPIIYGAAPDQFIEHDPDCSASLQRSGIRISASSASAATPCGVLGSNGIVTDCSPLQLRHDEPRPLSLDPRSVGLRLSRMAGLWQPKFFADRARLRMLIAFAKAREPTLNLTVAEAMAQKQWIDVVVIYARTCFIALALLLAIAAVPLLVQARRRARTLARVTKT